MNATLLFRRNNCDVVVSNKSGEPPTPEQSKEAVEMFCGGEDFFSAPSRDGVPFQLHVLYQRRLPSDQGHVYDGGRVATNVVAPVYVEYNLLTLQADHVTYDAERKELNATGSVEVVDEIGSTKRGDSMRFKIEDGQAILQH